MGVPQRGTLQKETLRGLSYCALISSIPENDFRTFFFNSIIFCIFALDFVQKNLINKLDFV